MGKFDIKMKQLKICYLICYDIIHDVEQNTFPTFTLSIITGEKTKKNSAK